MLLIPDGMYERPRAVWVTLLCGICLEKGISLSLLYYPAFLSSSLFSCMMFLYSCVIICTAVCHGVK